MKIKQVVAEVDITGITGTAVRSCSLKLQNSDGDAVDGTYLDYVGKNGDFEVTATTLSTKLVGISFDVSQAAPEGYGLLSISYKPETVTIAGEDSTDRYLEPGDPGGSTESGRQDRKCAEYGRYQSVSADRHSRFRRKMIRVLW